jgi:hypothetical protein
VINWVVNQPIKDVPLSVIGIGHCYPSKFWIRGSGAVETTSLEDGCFLNTNTGENGGGLREGGWLKNHHGGNCQVMGMSAYAAREERCEQMSKNSHTKQCGSWMD